MRYLAIFLRTNGRPATTPQHTAPEGELAPIVPGAFAAWAARTTEPPATPHPARVPNPARSQDRAPAL